jgi:hypothetical protein
MDHYYSQQLRDAVSALVGDGTLAERLEYTKQPFVKLSIHGHDTRPPYSQQFTTIKERLARLGSLSETEMNALASDILDLYVLIKIDWYRWEQTNPN